MAGRTIADGPEAYPYDPSLRMESQRGLDRLRCVADRTLAANLFVLFEAAERNSAAATAADRELEARRLAELKALQTLAARTLEGGLGPKPKELADSLLLDERGESVTDERSLREFAFALRQLRRLAG
ncbi:MAG: hypothetical protein ABI548_07615 [Polyangiaceae bacterium]